MISTDQIEALRYSQEWVHRTIEESGEARFRQALDDLIRQGRIRGWWVDENPQSFDYELRVTVHDRAELTMCLRRDRLVNNVRGYLEAVVRDLCRMLDHRTEPFISRDRDEEVNEADLKAIKLFKRVAGEEAYAALNKPQGSLTITSSHGTEYVMHKRYSYCVKRVRDKKSFCAQVPRVPLWDHLLGIKLMIEHDEPSFLKVAHADTYDYGIGNLPLNFGFDPFPSPPRQRTETWLMPAFTLQDSRSIACVNTTA